jgi:hypothetical protein
MPAETARSRISSAVFQQLLAARKGLLQLQFDDQVKARLVITAVTVEKRPVSEVARSYGVARSWAARAPRSCPGLMTTPGPPQASWLTSSRQPWHGSPRCAGRRDEHVAARQRPIADTWRVR